MLNNELKQMHPYGLSGGEPNYLPVDEACAAKAKAIRQRQSENTAYLYVTIVNMIP